MDFGLLFFNARWVDPSTGRFAQADTLIPQGQGVQAWDRYAFVNNNPVKYTDPSGHCALKLGFRCPTNPKITIPKVRHLSTTSGLYVGDNYPKSQLERQEDIYEGGPVDLIDSQSQAAEDRNISSNANVYTTIYYDEYSDGGLDVVSIGVENNSDYKVTVESVLINFTADSVSSILSPQLADDQSYWLNPLRIDKPGINGLMAVEPQTSETMMLVPSGNSSNTNNHFDLTVAEKLTVTVYFRFLPDPHRDFRVFYLTD